MGVTVVGNPAATVITSSPGFMRRAPSLGEVSAMLEEILQIKLTYERLAPRESDQKIFVADTGKITKYLNWKPQVSKYEGIKRMLAWVEQMK